MAILPSLLAERFANREWIERLGGDEPASPVTRVRSLIYPRRSTNQPTRQRPASADEATKKAP
jgi:hypothetical protein